MLIFMELWTGTNCIGVQSKFSVLCHPSNLEKNTDSLTINASMLQFIPFFHATDGIEVLAFAVNPITNFLYRDLARNLVEKGGKFAYSFTSTPY